MLHIPLVRNDEVDWLFLLCQMLACYHQSKFYHVETCGNRSFRLLDVSGEIGRS